MATIIEQLQQIGFSQYEAQAYIALLGEHPLNGYELAKISGIPRPNIYAVLQKLEERGAILRLDGEEGTRYLPVPPDEFFSQLKQRYQSVLQSASEELSRLNAPVVMEQILNIRGYAALLDHARALITSAKQRLLISVWPEEAMALVEVMQQAQERGVEIVTLCLHGCPQPCPACQGEVFRYAIAAAGSGRWLVLVQDGYELLAGEISSQNEAQSVRTRQEMLVNLTASYIQNSIALASILSGLGDRLETLLDPQTLRAINSLRPLHAQGEWLTVMRQMLSPR